MAIFDTAGFLSTKTATACLCPDFSSIRRQNGRFLLPLKHIRVIRLQRYFFASANKLLDARAESSQPLNANGRDHTSRLAYIFRRIGTVVRLSKLRLINGDQGCADAVRPNYSAQSPSSRLSANQLIQVNDVIKTDERLRFLPFAITTPKP